jgi:predicted Rossmann fold nucleotide-binding protein DprA/Smf involved in DNA uptake
LATVLLTSRLASDGVQPLKASEFWRLLGAVGAAGSLLGSDESVLVRDHGLDPALAQRVVALLGRVTTIAIEIDALHQSGIDTLTPFDEHYPQRYLDRLGAGAPPVLHAVGALELLDRAGAGIVADLDTSDEGVDAACALAARAVELGLPVANGGGSGIDRATMDTTLDAGGSVVGILADSLVRTARQPALRRAIYGGTTVLCTPYRPDAGATPVASAGRLKLIYAQAACTVVIATAEGSGATWAAATAALKEGHGPVAVWRGPGDGPGNAALEQLGATPIVTPDTPVLARLWRSGPG